MALVIRVIRLTGFLFVIFGLLVFSNLGGVAGVIGLDGDERTAKIFGGALMFTGLVDIVFIPRFLERIKRTT